MTPRFEGRAAIVTGGASGIGYETARRLTEEGANVAIWDLDDAKVADAAGAIGGRTDGVAIDITDHEAVEAATRRAIDMFGQIDILVCSAGITGPNLTTWDYPVEDWAQVFDVNVHGLFYCNRAVAPHMMHRKYGRIVNIASIAGKEGNPNAPAYSASKAAVIALTKSLGKELARTGVTVNAITPAAVKTAMFSQMTQQHIDYMLSKIPMNRFGTVEENAALICWLASEECSFSTGSVFDISGGRATY
ncbi:SDR family oxidoreductase [Kaustia mangrovi]|mgnify:CR=1 FL=1|uniref:SDR family oxidoreductase n=1 Tax=Kaustia mangrovi TaxID=2593653 RepID=A0A7S8C3E0_9HYPH|nr:SDR family NAD(P)-dependent oxidoreductase [Kaustia mangrovi]QPC42639.1 SDR family oxidoreductase [Kaustia mangrovi]